MVDADDHPDEVSVPQQNEKPPQANNNNGSRPPNMQPPARPLSRSHSAGNPQRAPHTPAPNYPPRPGPQNQANRPSHPLQQQMNQPRSQNGGQNAGQNGGSARDSISSGNGSHQTPPQAHNPPGHAQAPNAAHPSEGVGFLSARAVKQLVGSDDQSVEKAKLPSVPLSTQAFNPHAESPSIRKTPGIDHTTSKPLHRSGKHVDPKETKATDTEDKNLGPVPISFGTGSGKPGPGGNVGAGGFGSTGSGSSVGQPKQGPIPAQRGSIANPQLNQARRIGAPVGSPMGNRGQYKPPTIKRPLQGEGGNGGAPGAARPPLVEVGVNGTINTASGGGAVGGDPKRQKMG